MNDAQRARIEQIVDYLKATQTALRSIQLALGITAEEEDEKIARLEWHDGLKSTDRYQVMVEASNDLCAMSDAVRAARAKLREAVALYESWPVAKEKAA
jgi:hypothetical protein